MTNLHNCDQRAHHPDLQSFSLHTHAVDRSHWAQAVRASQPNVLSKFDYRNSCTPDVKSSIRSFFRDLVDIPKRLIDGDGMPNLHDDLSPDTSACNQQKYGRSDPPTYNLSAISSPLALFTGKCWLKGRRHPSPWVTDQVLESVSLLLFLSEESTYV